MNIVYYSSDLFSEMCGVAIQSLCENNEDADDINTVSYTHLTLPTIA